jgi:hypothetical protein
LLFAPKSFNPIGSSPHAWGTLEKEQPGSAFLRFIPTCVGNASPLLGICIERAVHPHMRGERTSSKPYEILDFQRAQIFTEI